MLSTKFYVRAIAALLAVVTPLSCAPGRFFHGIAGDITHGLSQIFGEINPNGCSKNMGWFSTGSTFDADVLAKNFILFNNVWAAKLTQPGSFQQVKCNNFKNGRVEWQTKFHFSSRKENEVNVKSYSNVAWLGGTPIKIRDLKKFDTTWNWQMLNSNELIADVSYDIFTSLKAECSGQSGGCASHEIMIWLQAFGGALPAGEQVPGKDIRIGTHHFNVWKGVVNSIPVITLIPPNPKNKYKNFSADLINVLKYNLTEFGLSPEEYVSTVGGGIEAFVGGGELVSDYILDMA